MSKLKKRLNIFLILLGLFCLKNLTASITFSSEDASLVIKNYSSKVKLNPSTVTGWRDGSIVPKVSGIGLGDYNLKQYDYSLDSVVTYSEVSNNMGSVDWNIPANTSVHIRENIYMDGYGGTINLGENSQLFVDDNVTLTLRNVTVSSTKNFAGNPAIQLASSRSALALDNVKLDVMNDFYFNRGSLFVHNDVKFTGTSAFIYRSCQPSFITSGARLIFDTRTTFSFAPATYTVCPYSVSRTYTANNFIKMADQTSKIVFNGCDFKTTLTGLRLTTGEIDFDNRVNLDSNTTNTIAGIPATLIGSIPTGTTPQSLDWSPDGRFFAVVNASTPVLQIFRFVETGNPVSVGSVSVGTNPWCVSWSPDGRFLAVVNYATPSLQIFSFAGSGAPTLLSTVTTSAGPISVNWSPDGRYLAVAYDTASLLQVFRFSGSGNSILVSSIAADLSAYSVNWSPDGRFLAIINWGASTLQVFSFSENGGLALVGFRSTGTNPRSVNWSPDGRFLAVANWGANTLEIFRFRGTGNPMSLGFVATGTHPIRASWSPDGRYVAVAVNGLSMLKIFKFNSDGAPILMGSVATDSSPWFLCWSGDGSYMAVVNRSLSTLQVFRVKYINNVDTQNISNSIVFGNSGMTPLALSNKITSSYDCTVKLLSGANVSVDGILNIDNSQTNTNSVQFASDNSRFVLKDWKSKIRMNPSTILGWRDSSIVPNVSGIGLGDYNLKQYDYVPDNTITYSEVSNSMQFMDWNIPANTIVHVRENIYMDGYGGTINLGENSELFVDDNVTLTLRNVTVSSSKNWFGNPPIRLASTRSKLAIDKVNFDLVNDFYFDRGQLFVYNDVNFSGTSAFIYRSTMPSYIKSGANLKFNNGTTFDFRPSTTGTPGLLAKDLLMMDDATSKIAFDGASLKSTLTGLRLTDGQVVFDNKVSLTSQAALRLVDYTTTVTNWVYHAGASSLILQISWHPSGRYVAVIGANAASDLTLFYFNGTSLSIIGSTYDLGSIGYAVNWSPDGKYLAAGGSSGVSIYSFNGTSLLPVYSIKPYTTSTYSVKWNPDGKYLAICGGNSTASSAYVYSFNGTTLSRVASSPATFSSYSLDVDWSPDGKYLAFIGNDTSNSFRVYAFTGSALNLVEQRYISAGLNDGRCVWSPDGHYIAVGSIGTNQPGYQYLNIFYFTGSKLARVTGLNLGTGVFGVAWSADGGYLAVGSNGTPKMITYEFKNSTLTQVGSGFSVGTVVRALAWSPNGNFLAIGASNTTRPAVEFNINSLRYGPETQTQNISNSIVLGNSSAGSASDITLKLLSGANVSVDGILNIDNSQTNTNSVIFANDNARFVLKDWKSKIRSNLNSMQGWRDSSIVPQVSGFGLGDYNVNQYDYNFDNLITYSDVSSSMQYMNWNIPDNTSVHIRENIYMDGYGGTINLGENSQLFVDDNVTLTLRNVTVQNTKNYLSASPIKLASTRSQLVLDNAKLDFANDFYFDTGRLFVYNDVNFSGTNSFIYRSTVPSYIKSGGNLRFNSGSSFDFRPSTTGMPDLLAKDLLIMDDATSKITFDGSALKTTLTGMRLTTGQVVFDNKVSMTSQSQFALKSLGTWVKQNYGDFALSVNWSPDGRYLAVGGLTPTSLNEIQVYRFTGSALSFVTSLDYGSSVRSVNWSPDGRYLAVGGGTPTSGSEIQVYRFTGSALSLVASQDYSSASGLVYSVNWSPDGKYLAVGGTTPTSGNEIQVYRFTGSALSLVASQDYGAVSCYVCSVSWSPDGRYLAVGGSAPTSGNEIQVYSFTGSALAIVVSRDYGSQAWSVNWSPDGRFLAVGGYAPTSGNEIQVYRFTGSALAIVAWQDYGNVAYSVNWSPDGRYLAVGGNVPTSGNETQLYKFTGSALSLIDSLNFGTNIRSVNWSPDGKYLAAVGDGPDSGHEEIEVYTLYYGPETQTQNISNSIVFGNSLSQPLSLSTKQTSTYDVTVKLLSGANVEVDGLLNIDNSQTNTNSVIFSSDNSRFALKDWRSKIRSNLNSMQGWRDSSIVPQVSGLGLGDYNLKNYDYIPDNTLIYSEVSNSMQYADWNIPANTIVHVKENIYMDGYGGTINIGENSELFVDDNVTLTLRNVTVSSSKNGPGNPAIKLASNRSKLALDSVKLDFSDDFYFNRGQLFVHNDVKFTGTNAFVYRSPVQSFITSGANLMFDTGTTFSVVPATFTACPYSTFPTTTVNNFILMSDKTSQININGATFATTVTGLRLTNGAMTFNNKVNLESKVGADISATPFSGIIATGTAAPQTITSSWSPDGRYVLASSYDAGMFYIFYFNGSSLVDKTSGGVSLDQTIFGSWSPDGKFVAMPSYSLNKVAVYSVTDGVPTFVTSAPTKYVQASASKWSPDGKYIATASTGATPGVEVFAFNGTALQSVASLTTSMHSYNLEWSPDGKYFSVGTFDATNSTFSIFSFTPPSSLSLVGALTLGTHVYDVPWSPDGRFIAVTRRSTDNSLQIYSFKGRGAPLLVGSISIGIDPAGAAWSPDGRYVAVCGLTNTTNNIKVYSFNPGIAPNFALALVGQTTLTGGVQKINFSPNGLFLAASGVTGNVFIFGVNYVNTTVTQATSNSIVFGNSAVGSASDINLNLLSGANVSVAGILNYDNTQGYTIFSNDNARFVLKDANAKIRMRPGTVVGWKERSMIKNLTGKGLGDYNLLNYDTTPPTDIVGYSEAPGELVYDNSNAAKYMVYLRQILPAANSNAILYLSRRLRNDSNALMAWGKQTSNAMNSFVSPLGVINRGTSNAILSWIKQTSNAAVAQDNRVKWNSNSIIYLNTPLTDNSNSIIKLGGDIRNDSNSLVAQDRRIRTNSNAIKYLTDRFVSVNNGKMTVYGGISGTTNVAGRGYLNSPIDLQGGTLTLNSDMILSNQTTIASSGNFDLQGNAMVLGGDLTIPSNVAIKIVSSGVLDGQGNELRNAIGAKLIVDNNVSLTLRNMNWFAAGSPQVEMRTATSRLSLQNLVTNFDRDYSFTQGKLFIQDDVFVTGTNKFSYVSTTTSYIAPHSTLYFDKNMTFSYSPRVNARHTRSERNLIKLLDKTAEIYFNDCVLQLPDSGWQLTTGTIYFDNGVTVYGSSAQADSFEWGDGSTAGDLDIKMLSGAYLNNYGYVYHNPGS